jgi:hypothetical protein
MFIVVCVFATLVAMGIMLIVEGVMAGRQHRRPEPGTVVLAGLLGTAAFFAVAYAGGLL